MENNQRRGTEISVLESLRQSDQEMEELLANLEERIPDVYTLENILMREIDVGVPSVIIVSCPNILMACTLNIQNRRSDGPNAVTLNLMMLKGSRKGKEIQEANSTYTMINFLIWNTRGVNTMVFHRHYEVLVKTHKSTKLVRLETKINDHKNIIDALRYDAYIQAPTDGMLSEIVVMWKEELLKLDSLSVTPQGIHILVKVISKHLSCLFLLFMLVMIFVLG